MACLEVTDGGDIFRVWKVTANILDKQLRTVEKWWSCGLGFGRGAKDASPLKLNVLRKPRSLTDSLKRFQQQNRVGKARSGLTWLRTGSSGGLLWTLW